MDYDDLQYLKAMGTEMNRQDNLATNAPYFCIMDKRDINSENGDIVKWFNSNSQSEIELDEADELVAQYKKDNAVEYEVMEVESIDEDDLRDAVLEELGYTKYHYETIEHFTGVVFFTKEAAERHIEARRYRYNQPYVYAKSAYDSPELKRVMHIISRLGENPNSNSYPKP